MAIRRFLGNLWGGSASTRTTGVQTSAISSTTSDTNEPINMGSALTLSSVWACVGLYADLVGSLRLNIYKIDEDGVKSPAKDHPLYRLFNGKMNRWQTRTEYLETVDYQFSLTGNSYSMITRDSKDRITAITPLMTEQMEVTLLESGEVIYTYTEGQNVRVFSAKNIMHHKGLGNGITGLSTIEHAANAIGVGLSAEKAVAKIYKNGGKPSGLLMIDKVISEDQRAKIKKNFSDMTNGPDARLFVLEAGMQYQQVSLSPQDIELLSSRKFQIEDIARFFKVPGVLINSNSSGTTWGSGIQQIVDGFYKVSLRPRLERYENRMMVSLLSPKERLDHVIEFDFSTILTPSKVDRINLNKEAIMSGQMTPNEARSSEGQEALEGGDNLYMQQQMTPLSLLKDGMVDDTITPSEE